MGPNATDLAIIKQVASKLTSFGFRVGGDIYS